MARYMFPMMYVVGSTESFIRAIQEVARYAAPHAPALRLRRGLSQKLRPSHPRERMLMQARKQSCRFRAEQRKRWLRWAIASTTEKWAALVVEAAMGPRGRARLWVPVSQVRNGCGAMAATPEF